jgi:hypothetical protein
MKVYIITGPPDIRAIYPSREKAEAEIRRRAENAVDPQAEATFYSVEEIDSNEAFT